MKVVDPWGDSDVKIDEALIKEFGLKVFSKEELKKLDHYLFDRGILVAHRDFQFIQKAMDEKKPFGQLTGIATSGPLHFGHKVDVDMFMYFRDKGAKSKFALTDIDAYCSRPDSKIPDMKTAKALALNNANHVLALGLKPNEVYAQNQQPSRYFELAFEVSKKITENTFRGIYGHVDLGKIGANLLQYADILHIQLPEFFGTMPTLTCAGVDQDPHARAVRDIAKRLPYKFFQPSFGYFQHQAGLQEGKKMSASHPATAIFLDDAPEVASKKIDRAFSGGRETLEEHKKLGGEPDKDKTFELLKFHHPDTKKIEEMHEGYSSGNLTTADLKGFAKDFITKFLKEHQKKVAKTESAAHKIVYG
ncbi:MAG: tryptophan--tRNA ligase [Candidatus Woesearchaeota archaeon]|jgi:tryptophanyl-tRNA synthetase|nr:tryptophan--tRNA ligase [Candidatus Woesearchaeota archaeon]MDP7181168.1 tryptophan--tRNA ligase [Candidatus Woesearchaeota archaeon]MDP7198211.1 tryptophan--tRNA ligase [Candidatus Woesearchaeota archaeon]MDP7467047.1 tryptophan--tRNA ligase [Candidatus Woesearchaeota archaeon]MDP7646715.1 tryptophan--tRNA ligase [Candidatus Woesearchaeota archaeon]